MKLTPLVCYEQGVFYVASMSGKRYFVSGEVEELLEDMEQLILHWLQVREMKREGTGQWA